jgi:hypothetical protein
VTSPAKRAEQLEQLATQYRDLNRRFAALNAAHPRETTLEMLDVIRLRTLAAFEIANLVTGS